MARRPRRTEPRRPSPPAPATAPPPSEEGNPDPPPATDRRRVAAAVAALLALHVGLAVNSLVRENPTVDEVVHLPAGITYWQTGTFRLYPHNPPLFKLIAAVPAVLSGTVTAPIYAGPYWRADPPNKAGVAHEFAKLNAERYFEVFTLARLVMPAFSVLGGLAVFAWSARLYGPAGGLLSLALWCLCPNVLAHARLVTSDVAATALGAGATYLFWRYLHDPSWRRAALAGLTLGAAELTKFSLLLLYGLWPLIWLVHEAARPDRAGFFKRLGRAAGQGGAIVALSLLVIDLGYGFEGVGRPLGDYPFVSAALTRRLDPPALQDPRPADLYDRIREYRVNRFRGTLFGTLPAPLPRYYLSGLDEQKLEAEGIPQRFLAPVEIADRMSPEEGDAVSGYPVYLDGQLSRRSWWYYYFCALAYKVPEGTWLLVALSLAVLAGSPRARAPWADEAAVLIVPAVLLGVISVGTNINLGLRYVLPIFPFLFIAAGKLAPWAATRATPGRRRLAALALGSSLGLTALATLTIHPHYLAYFNRISGGPARGSEHLIDSNLDWGQDLASLERWAREHAPGEPIGIAYFGQIPPSIFALRGRPLDWFLPPIRPGAMREPVASHLIGGPGATLTPGLYAVSASLLRGLPWRVYDPARWAPYDIGFHAFSYFQALRPIGQLGHSILLYRLTAADVARLTPLPPAPPVPGP